MENISFNRDFYIAVFTHTQYKNHNPVYGPADTLVDFLKGTIGGALFYAKHSIYEGDGSSLEIYKNGKLSGVKRRSFSKNFPNIFRYIVDFFSTFFWLIFKKRLDVVVAVDPLNFFYGYILKKFNKVDKTVYYTVDYAHRRFNNFFFNKIYHWLDSFSVKRADILWSSCRKICEIRKKQGVDDKRNIYLSNVPILYELKTKTEGEIDKFSLVNIFSNPKHIDFDIMFDALARLLEYYPKANLKLIGKGDFEDEVMAKIKNDKVRARVKCMDIISHDQALEEVSRCAIGLECNAHKEFWNEFREPIKIMEYIALGLPIISKPGHGVVEMIKENNLGFIVNDSQEFFEKIDLLFSKPALYKEIRENVCNLSKSLDKEKIILESLCELKVS